MVYVKMMFFFFLLKKQLYRVLMSIKETRPMYMPNLTCGM